MNTISFPLCKRIFDLIATSIIAVLLLPIILLILFAYLLESAFIKNSRGSLLYSEVRISQGMEFKIYKFRIFKISSLQKAANEGVVHTKKLEQNTENLTLLGRFLKKVYLDELPQLYNILKGDMTLVGPRPTNLENYYKLISEGKYAKKILRAGLTGYFQSHKGVALSMDQNSIDTEYAHFLTQANCWQIIKYDTTMLLISIKTVLRAEGI